MYRYNIFKKILYLLYVAGCAANRGAMLGCVWVSKAVWVDVMLAVMMSVLMAHRAS